jgi:hypothetical protein
MTTSNGWADRDALVATACGDHGVPLGAQGIGQRAQQQGIVVHQQDPQGPDGWGRVGRLQLDRHAVALIAVGGEVQADGGALTFGALDRDRGTMSLHAPVDHGQAQPGAPLALGGEERLQAAALRLFVHADTRVAHRELHARCAIGQHGAPGPQGERAALGHGVHGIEHEVGHGVADLALHHKHW